jgi:hypothetical protein
MHFYNNAGSYNSKKWKRVKNGCGFGFRSQLAPIDYNAHSVAKWGHRQLPSMHEKTKTMDGDLANVDGIKLLN